jgi:hypothetical protein
VILPVFKAGDPSLRGVDGGFDSHSSPPYLLIYQYVTATRGNIKGEACGFLAHKQAPSVRSVQLGYTENQSKSHKFV